MTLAELGMAFWHDLAAPVIAGAWATMHALLNEPLTAGISTPLTSTILEFY